MVSLKWCFGQKDGIKTIEPNDNLAKTESTGLIIPEEK